MYYVRSYGRDGSADHICVDERFDSLDEAREFIREQLGIDTTDQGLWWSGVDDEPDLVPVEGWNENYDEGCGGVQIYRRAA